MTKGTKKAKSSPAKKAPSKPAKKRGGARPGAGRPRTRERAPGEDEREAIRKALVEQEREKPAGPGLPPLSEFLKEGEDPRRRCVTIIPATGERCKRSPIIGGFVCAYHGGSAPQVRAKAKERLRELLDPALNTLLRLLSADSGACPVCGRSEDSRVILRAALAILDRTGHGPKSTIELERDAIRDLTGVSREQMRERLEELRGILAAEGKGEDNDSGNTVR